MNSHHLWFWSACTDAPAIASTPGRALFSWSTRACQEQNSDQFDAAAAAEFGPESTSSDRNWVDQRLPSEERSEVRHHAVLHCRVRLKRVTARMGGQDNIRERGQRIGR